MVSQDLKVSSCSGQNKGWSIERQVHIVAGFLILIGIGCAYIVYPPFIWISVIVALGMIVSGITDSCGMAFLIAQLPWNKKKSL